LSDSSETTKFIEDSEQLMSVNYRIYDKIRDLKREVRNERSQRLMQNILNPDLKQSVLPDSELPSGLIDDFDQLDYDYDLNEDDAYEFPYYDDNQTSSDDQEEEEDLWED
jgi:hypothetical protein